MCVCVEQEQDMRNMVNEKAEKEKQKDSSPKERTKNGRCFSRKQNIQIVNLILIVQFLSFSESYE